MKSLLTLVIFVYGFGSLKAEDHPFRRLDGLWYNHYKDRTIEIHAYQDGLKVRGLRPGNRWVWLDRANANTYYDQYGNRLKVYNEFIRYNTRRMRGKLTFVKLHIKDRNHDHYRNSDHSRSDNRSRHSQNHGWADDDFEDESDVDGYEGRDQKWNKDDDIIHNKSNTTRYEGNDTDLEGTWSVNGLDKKVYVTETRDGFKARFNDDPNWYKFTKQVSGIFIDENGNKYYFDNGQLIWEDNRGLRKYNLTKISDEYGNE